MLTTKPKCKVEMKDANGEFSCEELDKWGNEYKFESSAKLSVIAFKRMFHRATYADFRIVSI